MAAKGPTIETEVWLTLTPQFNHWTHPVTQEREVKSFSVAVTKGRPTGRKEAGALLMKTRIRLPVKAFQPLRPQVTIDVSEDMLVLDGPIEIEATEPDA